MTDLLKDISEVLNRHSAENESGTPDFILSHFLTDTLEAFNEAVKARGVWRGEEVEFLVKHEEKLEAPVEEDREATFIEKTIDDIIQNQANARIQLVHNLMNDPGFLSTFGDDFVMEFGDIELYTDNRREIDNFKLSIRQDITFRRRTPEDN